MVERGLEDHRIPKPTPSVGEVRDGSSFSIPREKVFPGQWKTAKLRIHVNGCMFLLKSFSRDEDSSRLRFQKSGQQPVGGPGGSYRLLKRFEPRRFLRTPFRQNQACRRMIIFSSSSLPKTHTRRLIPMVRSEDSAH